MACTIKLQIENYENAQRVKHILDIAQVENPYNITMDDIVSAIMNLDKQTRTTLADYLRSAKVQQVSEKDIKEHHFISNTTIDGLKEAYPELAIANSGYASFKPSMVVLLIK